MKFTRKRRDLRKTERELQAKHHDLRITQKKLAELNRGARLRWIDLTIGKRIASGTISKVYRAQLSDMEVVVKKLPKRFNQTRWRSSPYDVFLEEAETLRSLRHMNVVIFLGAGQDNADGCPFLVMEYLRRGSLYDNLHDPKVYIEPNDQLRFALDIARGMRYLHSSSPPQIHRDLKSSNLLVSDKWVVKIGDLEFTRYLSLVERDDQAQPSQDDHTAAERNATSDNTTVADGTTAIGEGERLPKTPSIMTSTDTSDSSDADDVTIPLLHNVKPSPSAQLINTSTTSHQDVSREGGDTESRSRDRFTASQLPSRVGMTCGVGTDRWRAPETLSKNSYTEKSDVYR